MDESVIRIRGGSRVALCVLHLRLKRRKWPKRGFMSSKYEKTYQALLTQLQAKHGDHLDGAALMALLKFTSGRSFRRAAAQGSLPFPVSKGMGVHGWAARTQDVAAWLSKIHSRYY